MLPVNPVNNDKESNQSWSSWNYGKTILAAAAMVSSTYFGFNYLSQLWKGVGGQAGLLPTDNGANDVDVTVDLSLSMSNLPHYSPASRSLLSTNVTVVNPVQDIQFEASVEDRYTFDAATIFSGNVETIAVLSSGNTPLPSWARFDAIIGSFETLGVGDVVLQGSIAFLCVGVGSLQVLDVSNPAIPILLGSYDTLGSALGVTVVGSTAYVAGGNSGLHVLDVSNPANITLLGSYDTPGQAYDVVVFGSTAYVADSNSGLQVLDLTNPANITLLGSYDTPGLAWGLVVFGSMAYVADGNSLQVLDVSNPSNITCLGGYDTPGQAVDIAIQGSTAYVAGGISGLQVLDVSNLAAITLFGSYDTSGVARSVVLKGSTAYLADWTSGLQLLDVSNPAAPVLLGSYDTPGWASAVFVQDNTVFVADVFSGLQIMDFSRGSLVGTATTALVGQIYSLEVFAYNIGWQAMVSDAFTLTVNQQPKRRDSSLVNHRLFPGEELRLVFDVDTLFSDPDNQFLRLSIVANGQGSLPTWLNFELTPIFLGSYDPGTVQTVVVQESMAFVIQSKLEVLDVSNPTLPKLLGSYSAPWAAFSVFVQGSRAYVSYHIPGLQIVDVSDPAAITLLGSYNTPDQARAIFVQGGTAFVADWHSGLQVLDVSNPAAIALLGSYDTPGLAESVVVQDGIAYVVDGSSLQVLDVSNPATIVFLGSYSTLYDARSVFVQDNVAYVADTSSLQMLDVSNPTTPTLLKSYDTPIYVYDVFVKGSTVFVAEFITGIQALDVSNTSKPNLLGGYDTPGAGLAVFLQEGILYVADQNSGLQILDVSQWEFSANPTTTNVGNYEITLTATDHLGGTASDSFIIRVEGPPVFNGTLPNQAISVGDAYNYFVPQGVVVDPNADAVTFSASLSNDASLPSWLSFNPFSATFTGTPDVAGQYVVKVSATDGIAGSTSTNFNLNVSHKPQIQQPIIDPFPWRGGREFTFVIPNNAFVDLNGNALLYSARLNNGDSLPSWLQFDATTATFSGTPPVGEISIFDVLVTATDPATGSSATQNFQLQITENFPPVLDNPISTQVATATKDFRFTVPSTTFNDPNQDPLTYSASGIGGESLPKWLHFFPESRTFAGKPGRGDTGTYADKVVGVEVTASDGEKSTNTAFNISVKGASHWELAIKVGAPLISGLSLLLGCYGGRAYCLNRMNKSKYQKLQQSVGVGEVGALIDLSADPKKIRSVRAKVLKAPPKNCCQKLSRFFRSPRQALPDGDLPYWLNYFPNSNQLAVVNGGPGEADVGEVIIQVKDSAGVTLEQFPLQVVSAQQSAAMTHIEYDTAPDNPVFGEDAVNDEAGGIPMTTFS